ARTGEWPMLLALVLLLLGALILRRTGFGD
ncbi:hypothetical protein LCGC14_2087610, partial [marine sediment metagenome]